MGGSLSQPRLNIFAVGNMRVMICLGQGGLRSLSASSYFFNLMNISNIGSVVVTVTDSRVIRRGVLVT